MWHLRQAEGAAAIKAAAATTAAAQSIGGWSIVARRNWADYGWATGRSRHIASSQNATMRRCYQSIPAWRWVAGPLVAGSN